MLFTSTQILRFDIAENGGLSALPHVAMWLFNLFLSWIMERLRRNNTIKQSTVRKICTGISFLLPAICLVAVSFSGCNRLVVVISIGVMFVSGMYCGYLVNHEEIVPNYAGILISLTYRRLNLRKLRLGHNS